MDVAHIETEAVLSKVEKRLRKEYSRAARDMERKLDNYFEAFRRKDAKKRAQFMRHEITKEEYDRWRYGQLAVGKRWEDMRAKLADDMTHTDVIARSIVDGHMPEVYAINHNFATYQVETSAKINTSYTLYDAQSVERLVRENPDILPKIGRTTQQLIDDGILEKWNMKNIQSTMIQGILQGESINKLAKRMAADVGARNYKDCVRHARTMTTATQNAGRVDGFKRAKGMGIDMMQEWVAVLDMRTRHEHRQLNGQRREVGEPFEVDGYELQYPADPAAPYYLTMNCRCTLIGQLKGFERDINAYRNDPDLGGMTYEEWKNAKAPKKAKAAQITPAPKAQTPAPTAKATQPAAQGTNTAQVDGFNWIVNAANADKVAHNPVDMLKKPLTEEKIIAKIAGGDQTKGSCASLAICYAANKKGIDVGDFRGGNSQKLFSRRANNQKVYEAAGAKIDVHMVNKEAKEVAEILKGIDKDKEFILSAGKHSAVVKRTADGLQYLELQSPLDDGNGWKPFGDDVAKTLHDRWACRKTQERIMGMPVEQRVRLIDVDSIQPTAEFKGILGYINTPAAQQKRGVTGGIK